MVDSMARTVSVGSVKIGGPNPMALIAGPCVIESERLALETATAILDITRKLGVPFIFKSSYAKMNRMSRTSFAGPGLEEGLRVLEKVRAEVGVPVLTDVHSPQEALQAAEAVDIIQIPALLCRQTDLALAAARTGKPVNIKKGQFLAPEDMGPITEKIASAGNPRIIITERGSSFGYHNLVVDMRSLVVMKRFGYPVVFDATHSVQFPGGQGTKSGGDPAFILPLARGAAAIGIDAIFVETHPCVAEALCDASSMLPLERLEPFLLEVTAIAGLRQNAISGAPALARSRSDVLDMARKVKMLILDVDGVLTDGQVLFGPGGEMGKTFHVHDGKGIRLALRAGIRVGLISGRESEATRKRAADLGVQDCELGVGDKLAAYEAMLRKYHLEDGQIAYVGDDEEDLEVMDRVGLAATVPSAISSIRDRADYVTKAGGGDGAVREVVDLIIEAQNRTIA